MHYSGLVGYKTTVGLIFQDWVDVFLARSGNPVLPPSLRPHHHPSGNVGEEEGGSEARWGVIEIQEGGENFFFSSLSFPYEWGGNKVIFRSLSLSLAIIV